MKWYYKIARVLFFVVYLFLDRVSTTLSPGCYGTCNVKQADLELIEILLPLSPRCSLLVAAEEKKFLIYFYFMCFWCFALMYFCVRVLDFLDLELTNRCELLCGCWELNWNPLEEQPVLLTAEPSLQPEKKFLNGSLSENFNSKRNF